MSKSTVAHIVITDFRTVPSLQKETPCPSAFAPPPSPRQPRPRFPSLWTCVFRTLQVSRATLGGLRVWPPSPSIVRPCRGVCRGCLPCLGLSDIPQCGWPTFCVSVLPRQTRFSPPRTFRQFVTDAAVNIRASSAWACVSFLASVNPGAPSLGCVVTPRVALRGAARRFGRSASQCVSFCTGRRGDLWGAVESHTEVRTGGSRPRQGGVSGRPGGPRGGVGGGSVRSESSSLLGARGG